MKTLFNSRSFILGLLLRVAMIVVLLPNAAAIWYIPFLELTSGHFTLDPWTVFLAEGGNKAAFPYGYIMWLAFLPLTLVGNALGLGVYYAYSLTLLAADIFALFTLKNLFKLEMRTALLTYWLSPIVIFATYWLGYNDLIPISILLLALFFLRDRKPVLAGLFCGAGISAKLSMALSIPFFLIYLYRNIELRHLFKGFSISLAFAILITWLPFTFSQAGLEMLINNPEMIKVYELVLQIGINSSPIYLLPLAYLMMLYLTWRIRRISFQLLNILLGLSFLFVVLLTPASPGWFIWIVPMLVFFQAGRSKVGMWINVIFTLLYVFNALLITQSPLIVGSDIANRMIAQLGYLLGDKGSGILHTTLFALGLILIFRIWREAVLRDEYFRLSRKPFVIGIAGDSGAGKDTLVNSIVGLFGKHSVVNLSGDDYHLWDRTKPMWQVMTHLNPMANNLEQYAKDLIALANGNSIKSRKYDHASGKLSKAQTINSKDTIIASGLLALHQPILRSCYDLSIYLDINEELRRHFKIERDVQKRGQSLERVLTQLVTREVDSQKFVRPQALYADLVLSLQPIHPSMLERKVFEHLLRLKIVATSRHGFNEESLRRVLIGVCGLHVEMTVSADGSEVELSIEGETSSDDIAIAAEVLFPDILDFLDSKPAWEDGIQGLMQLITLSHINQSLKKRLI